MTSASARKAAKGDADILTSLFTLSRYMSASPFHPLAVGSDGQIYVSSNPGSGVASSILQIDPDTGNQTVISSGGGFGFLGGLVQAP